MRSVLVLGSGGSAAGLVTGVLPRSGTFFGDEQPRPSPRFPAGGAPGPEIIAINEALLAPAIPRANPTTRWLIAPRATLDLTPSTHHRQRMRALLSRRPFALWDPRLCATLPAWLPELDDARFVCVFRHPMVSGASLTRACAHTAPWFQHSHAIAAWAWAYRRLLEHLAPLADQTLFLHTRQLLEPSGQERLGAFLDTDITPGFIDAFRLAEPPLDPSLPAPTEQLYRSLCERAGWRDTPKPATRPEPDATLVAFVRSGDRPDVPDLVADAQGQRGVQIQLILVDQTDQGDLEVPEGVPDTQIIRDTSFSRGRAWRQVARQARGRVVLWLQPGCRALPTRAAHAVQALDREADADLIVHPCLVQSTDGSFVDTLPAGGEQLPPLWRGGVAVRARALSQMPTTGFRQAEQRFYQSLVTAGRARALGLPLSYALHERIRAVGPSPTPIIEPRDAPPQAPPAVSVLLHTRDRHGALRRVLEAWCEQLPPEGGFELIIVDRASKDATWPALQATELPISSQVLHLDTTELRPALLAATRAARGALLLVTDDQLVPAPDLARRHLRAHRDLGDEAVVVQGGPGRTPAPTALRRLLQQSGALFGRDPMQPRALNPARAISLGNLSLRADLLARAGGWGGAEGLEDIDLGLRLEDLGVPAYLEPEAHADGEPLADLETVARRVRARARGHVALFADHPTLMDRFDCHEITVADCARELRALGRSTEAVQAAISTLGTTDLAALERIGPDYQALAEQTQHRLEALIRYQSRSWWLDGFQTGMLDRGVDSMANILLQHPLPIPERRGRAWLLVPAGGAEERWIAVVQRYLAAFQEHDDVSLIIKTDARGVVEAQALERALSDITMRARVRHGRPLPHCILLDSHQHPGQEIRLLPLLDGWLRGGGAPDERLARQAGLAGLAETDPASWQADMAWPAADPLALPVNATWRIGAWPDWSRRRPLRSIARAAAPLAGREGFALCLLHNADQDGPLDRAREQLERVELGGVRVHLTSVGDAPPERIGRALDVVIQGEQAALLGCPLTTTLDEWLARVDASQPREPQRVELR